MKGLLFSLLLLTLAGCSVGEDAPPENEVNGLASNATASAHCESKEDADKHSDITNNFFCLYTIEKLLQLQSSMAVTRDEMREIFKLYCDTKSVSQCLSYAKGHLEECHKDLLDEGITAVMENAHSALDVLCRDHGAQAADVYNEFRSLTVENRRLLENCFSLSLPPIGRTLTFEETLPFVYIALERGRPCLLEKGAGVLTMVKEVEAMIGDVVGQMKCVNPQDKTIVLCSTVITREQISES